MRGSFNASFGAQLRRKSLHIPHPRRCTGNFDRLSNYRFLPLINPAPCPVPMPVREAPFSLSRYDARRL
ncbi:hypothetical protein ADT71_12040 [Novosphingobium sp. ST904]|nr:hypothetical protein ADT71_12040 [Novosphingobium sp. ST904]